MMKNLPILCILLVFGMMSMKRVKAQQQPFTNFAKPPIDATISACENDNVYVQLDVRSWILRRYLDNCYGLRKGNISLSFDVTVESYYNYEYSGDPLFRQGFFSDGMNIMNRDTTNGGGSLAGFDWYIRTCLEPDEVIIKDREMYQNELEPDHQATATLVYDDVNELLQSCGFLNNNNDAYTRELVYVTIQPGQTGGDYILVSKDYRVIIRNIKFFRKALNFTFNECVISSGDNNFSDFCTDFLNTSNMPKANVGTVNKEWEGSAFMTYPNPFNNSISIAFEAVTPAQIRVYNLQGQQILLSNITTNTGRLELATNTWQSGIYFIEMRGTNGEVVRQKIVKQ